MSIKILNGCQCVSITHMDNTALESEGKDSHATHQAAPCSTLHHKKRQDTFKVTKSMVRTKCIMIKFYLNWAGLSPSLSIRRKGGWAMCVTLFLTFLTIW